MKKTESNGLTSLVSMLSILFAFVAVCVICVAVLVRVGVMNVDWLAPASTTDEKQTPTTPSESGISGELGELTLDETSIRRVLSELPFFDNFYAKIYATYIGSGPDGIFKIESYDVYKSGGKYKIITYDNHMSKIKTEICDGTRVLIRDETNGSERLFPVGDEFSFYSVAPMPDFSAFKTERYDIDRYFISGDEYVFVCSFPDMKITDEVRVNALTGAVTSFKSTMNGRQFYTYELFTFDTDRTFDAGEFSVSE